ncbi:hypothetical protein BS17DRAFT_126281 [Gyrodon lividus]|nr:hypothetical protein BS17DRAFT_126281 [Gyrodon lividus]
MSPALVREASEQYVLVPIQISDVSFAVGYLLNFGLLGVLSLQVFIYATRFRRDPRWLHLAVFLVFFLEVFNSALVIYSVIVGARIRCLSCLITGQRNYVLNGVSMSETLSIWGFQALCVLTGSSSSLVQAFFAWRIWVLGRSIWIPTVVMVVSLGQCVTLMTGGILSSTDPDLGVFDTDGAVIWLIISATCDILITARTIQLLFRGQGGSHCKDTQSIIHKLVKLTIETGLVTVFATILEFLLAQTSGIAHHAVFYFLSKLYANCFLATLNARLVIHGAGRRHHTGVASAILEPEDIQLSTSLDIGDTALGSRRTLSSYKSIGVQIGALAVDCGDISRTNPGMLSLGAKVRPLSSVLTSHSRSTSVGSLFDSDDYCVKSTFEPVP